MNVCLFYFKNMKYHCQFRKYWDYYDKAIFIWDRLTDPTDVPTFIDTRMQEFLML